MYLEVTFLRKLVNQLNQGSPILNVYMVKPSTLSKLPKFKNLPIALKLQCVQELSGVLVKLVDSRFLPRESLIQSVNLGWGLENRTVNEHPQMILMQAFRRSQRNTDTDPATGLCLKGNVETSLSSPFPKQLPHPHRQGEIPENKTGGGRRGGKFIGL